jgi:hypothetical protein
MGLKSDSTVVAWGNNYDGQCDVPAPNEGFTAISAGEDHSLGFKGDGTIVAWGKNDDGQCDVPSPNEGFTAISAGYRHSLGLKSDSTLVAWGSNNLGQCDVPAPNEGFVAIAAGGNHSVGLKSNGTIVAWGFNYYGQCDVPAPNEDFVAIAAGISSSLGLKSGVLTAVEGSRPGRPSTQAPLAVISLAPNPPRAALELTLGIRISGPVEIEVYDARGRLVRRMPLGKMGPGLHRASWDGRDAMGADVASGVYFIRLHNQLATSEAVKAVLVR